ncbi:MAG: WbqC family protein [bacterium]
MILAAHTPNYLPDLSFFYKMSQADVFVFVDNLRQGKRSLTNRAKIKTARGTQWLTVPIVKKGRHGQSMNKVHILTSRHWQHKHRSSLMVNYKYAAYFEKYMDFFEDLYCYSWGSLIDLNLKIINFFVRSFHIKTETVLLSHLNIEGNGRELLVNLLKHLNCRRYLCEADYNNYLNTVEFSHHGLSVSYFPKKFSSYYQLFGEFVPGLSAVDLLFNEGEEGFKLLTNV